MRHQNLKSTTSEIILYNLKASYGKIELFIKRADIKWFIDDKVRNYYSLVNGADKSRVLQLWKTHCCQNVES